MESGPQPRYIEGKCLYLRPLDPRVDTDRYYLWMNTPEVTAHLLRQTPVSYPAEEQWVRQAATPSGYPTHYLFAVVLKEDNRHVGSVDVRNINWIDRTGEMGLLIGEPELWQKGHGFEAAMLGNSFAFRVINLRKLCSSTIATNAASIATHEKCGCVKIGLRRQQRFRDGSYVDEVLFEHFAEDFEVAWRKHASVLTCSGSA